MTRRDAIHAGIGTLGATAAQAQDGPVRVGIVGIGNRSKAHWGALAKMSEAKMVALADLESQRMKAVDEKLGIKTAHYTDYQEMLKDKNVQVVAIVTPGYLHKDMAVAAMRAGKDVMLEKPFGINYREALEIQREAKRTGRVLAVCMQRRYSVPDATTRWAIEQGRIGAIRLIDCTELRGDWFAGGWQYTDPKTGAKKNWRMVKAAAGSTELEFSVHAFAEIASLVKSPLARLSATGGVVHYKDRDTRDVSSLIADFANGVRLNYSFSCFAAGGGNSFTVVGDNGVLTRERGKILISTGRGAPQAVEAPPGISREDAEIQLYRDLFKSMRDRSQPALGPDAAMEPAKIAFAAEISITENRIVTARDFA
ncbi:MAG: Gfo/Idh/MocA family protein [Bryobacteraceae bacterium]